MTANTKISKVLEYLIKNDEEKAKEVLHQVFIEKARAIHEELMSADEDMEETMMHNPEEESEEENVHGSGDQGQDLTNEIQAMEDQIDFEETMDEGDEEAEGDAMDHHADDDEHHEHGEILDKMDDLEKDIKDALDELRAEFNRLEKKEAGEDEAGEDEAGEDEGDEGEMEMEDTFVAEEEEEEEGEMEESWDLDEDFDELAESLELEVIEKDPLKGNKSAGEVGSGHSGMSIESKPTSPLPKSQTSRFGAKPIETGKGATHNGYNMEAAPKHADLGIADNRRKKSTQGAQAMNSGNYGAKKVSNSKLETTASEFHTDSNKMSPLSRGGDNLK